MDLLPSPEQSEIIESSRSFLAARMSTARTRALFEAGTTPAVDPSAWSAAAELGWFALGLPVAHDGIGGGLVDEALLFREIGRAATPGPFVSTVLAARVAAFGGVASLAEEITSGRRVGLAVTGSTPRDVQLIDASDGLVLLVTPQRASIVEVAALDGVTTVPCVDPTVHLQRAVAPSGLMSVATVASVESDVDPIERRANVLIAATLTGISEWARDTSAEHAKHRVQFDRAIGVNQAIKHPCADSAVQAQLAYAQFLFAALAIDEGRPDAELQALNAFVTAAAAAEFATATTVQVLGGMGFTHEHDAHLYVKRVALWSQTLGGTPSRLSRLLAQPEPA